MWRRKEVGVRARRFNADARSAIQAIFVPSKVMSLALPNRSTVGLTGIHICIVAEQLTC